MTIECGFCSRVVLTTHPPDPRWFRNQLYECGNCATKRYEKQWDDMPAEAKKRFVASVNKLGFAALLLPEDLI